MRHEIVNGIDAEVAESAFERMRGLIGRDGLVHGKGMLITKCNCIHTLFMRFPIDATFLDRKGNVVKTVRCIRPWRPWIWGGWRAVSVLETAASCLKSAFVGLTVLSLVGCASSSPSKFVAAEQASGAISIYCDRPGRDPQLQWVWSAKGDPNVKPEWHRLFGVPDECKPRKDGKLILMNDSCGGFAGLDVGTGLCLFYGNAGGNPHSVELLPDGNVAVASSTGRTLKIFDVKEHPFEPEKQKCVTALDLPGGHGVVWDAKRGTLFALGYTNLYELAYTSETMSVKVLHCWDFTKNCVDAWGHDLVPDGKSGYYFTNHAAVWHFDPATGEFAKARAVENVKSFSPSPEGDLLSIPRERWWTDTLLVFPSGSSDRFSAREIAHPGAKFYKARWLH